MDTNKLLQENGYRGRSNYGEIAKYASELSKKTKSDKKVLEAVNAKFGTGAVTIGMLEKPAKWLSWLPKAFDELSASSNSMSIDQLETALRLPVADGGALMPDAHKGYALPIGGVLALKSAVFPAGVGFDIGCRMHLTILQGVTVKDIRADKYAWLDFVLGATSFGVGSVGQSYDHEVMHLDEWENIRTLKNLKALAYQQLGSSGAGNHFADIVSGVMLEDGVLGKGEKFVALMTHSGSRGAGNKAGQYYAELAEKETKARGYNVVKGYGFLGLDTWAGQEYWDAMQTLGAYAKANHEIIHSNFLKLIGGKAYFTVDNHHNFAWKENGMIVHRKGATPASKGTLGIIPGSSGTESYIVRGLGNKDSYNSASHGAGRLFSRTKAKEIFDEEKFVAHMSKNGILYWGVNADEAYTAYKSIELVMDSQKDLVAPIAKLFPEIVVMGGRQKQDDGD